MLLHLAHICKSCSPSKVSFVKSLLEWLSTKVAIWTTFSLWVAPMKLKLCNKFTNTVWILETYTVQINHQVIWNQKYRWLLAYNSLWNPAYSKNVHLWPSTNQVHPITPCLCHSHPFFYFIFHNLSFMLMLFIWYARHISTLHLIILYIILLFILISTSKRCTFLNKGSRFKSQSSRLRPRTPWLVS